jgi:ribosomal protein L40E
MEPKLVTVCTYTSAVQAEVVKLALEAEGVTAFVGDANMVTTDWLIGGALGGVKLQVAEVDVPAAMAVLASTASLTSPSADRPADDGVQRCLSCGATMPGETTTCPACGWSFLAGAKPEDAEATGNGDPVA